MIISASTDYRAAAQRRLPPFLFHYIDGGAYAEHTLKRNVSDLSDIALRQRILRNMSDLSLETELFGEKLAMPVALAPVGLTGMYARRGEVQAARGRQPRHPVHPVHRVGVPDRGWPRRSSGRCGSSCTCCGPRLHAQRAGARAGRRRDHAGVHRGHAGAGRALPRRAFGHERPERPLRRIGQAITHPHWAWDVGLLGRPHDLGNISTYRGNPTGLEDYIGWLGSNFDPSISWKDLEWIREFWKGPMVIKGILDPDDARDAVKFGADGIVVSNHGGRQLDGVLSTARALPAIADAVQGDLKILADSGIRNGLDVVRMLALGADTVLLGRAFVYALAAQGEAGVANLLDLIAKEMRVAMTLTGARRIADIGRDSLVSLP
jgi:L-lactate dehydrogenase (cytochrome)